MRNHTPFYRFYKRLPHAVVMRLLTALCILSLFLQDTGITVQADKREDNIAANQAVPIESNSVENWPVGPIVSAESAILMELETGVILYEKNIHAHEYPASTTKILTTLIAAEECSLDETVTFSKAAVYGIPRDSNHVAMEVGDTLSMELCLQAILIRSANEVSYAVAEHIDDTWESFAERMNARAAELGCVDSNFVNPNGLPDENHYTSAYDLAMIGRAFFSNEMLCQITQMPMLHIPKEKGDLYDANQMELLRGRKYAYEYLVGCKTGYTDAARSCLVSCAEKDGMKLICVVMRDESPNHYTDTLALYQYGFGNFEKVNVSQTETKYNIEGAGFYSDNDLFGNSKPILELNKQACVILPKTTDFDDLDSAISYSTNSSRQAAVIQYSYHGVPVGTASVDFTANQTEGYSFDSSEQQEEPEKEFREASVVFINILKVLLWIAGSAAVLFALFIAYTFFRNYESRHPNSRRNWKRSRKRRNNFYQQRNSSQAARRRQAIRQAKRRRKKSGSYKFRDYDF